MRSAVQAIAAIALMLALDGSADGSAWAQRSEDWVLLGSGLIDRTRDQERIDLKSAQGTVKAVRLVAKINGLELTKVTVAYAGGRAFDEARRINLNPNDRTRAIDPSSEERFVDHVDIFIQPNRGSSQRIMTLEVWGLQTAAGALVARPGSPAPAPVAAAIPAPAVVPTPPPPVAAVVPPRPPAPAVAAAPAWPPPVSVPAIVPPAPPPAPVPAVQSAPTPAAVAPAPMPAAPPATTASPPPEVTAVPAPRVVPPMEPPATPSPAVVAGTPGTAPPLPPARGPDGRAPRATEARAAETRVAALPRTPSPAPVPQPSAGDETRDGIFLGRRTLDSTAANETIPISAEIGRIDKLRLRVLDSGVRLSEVRIGYETGDPDVLGVEATLPATGRSRWLPVAGTRVVRDIALTYQRQGAGRGTPTIELYGEHPDGYLDPGGDGAKVVRYNGWVPLGAKTSALRLGQDQLDFQVGRNKGGFKKLRVDAKERAISLREVRVIYASGEDEIISIDPTRQRIGAGASFGPIDLRGSSRVIKDIILKTRSRFLDSEARGRDAAIVEVWGQH